MRAGAVMALARCFVNGGKTGRLADQDAVRQGGPTNLMATGGPNNDGFEEPRCGLVFVG